MKNAINYYFDLEPKVIRQVNNRFIFSIYNEKYYFVPYERKVDEIKDIYALNLEMIKRNILVHEIIQNKQNQPLTYVNNIPYILMKVYVNDLKIANLSDINDIQSKTVGISHNPSIRRENWFDLWTKKVDYLEYQMSQFSKRFPILIDSISYFVGLAENAISYIKNTTVDTKSTPLDEFVVSHRRIEKDATLYDIYNPLNFIIDHKVRDLGEYIKVNVFNDKNIWEEIHLYFKHNMFSPYGIRLLYGRLLYPTIYFDLFEEIIDRKCEEEAIVPTIKKISEYEEFLSDIFHYLNLMAPLPKIEWLIKK